jgi:hypothetical protein
VVPRADESVAVNEEFDMLRKLSWVAGLFGVAALSMGQTPASSTAPAPGLIVSGVKGVAEAAKDLNPLYAAWKGQEGKVAKYVRQETISGGAPMPGANGGRAGANVDVTYTLDKITAEQAMIKITRGADTSDSLVIPAMEAVDDPACPKPAGKEDVKIGDKTYACTKYTYRTKDKAEMGRDGQGLAGQVTVWVADGVPGGVVQKKILLTIRATYEIVETLAEK